MFVRQIKNCFFLPVVDKTLHRYESVQLQHHEAQWWNHIVIHTIIIIIISNRKTKGQVLPRSPFSRMFFGQCATKVLFACLFFSLVLSLFNPPPPSAHHTPCLTSTHPLACKPLILLFPAGKSLLCCQHRCCLCTHPLLHFNRTATVGWNDKRKHCHKSDVCYDKTGETSGVLITAISSLRSSTPKKRKSANIRVHKQVSGTITTRCYNNGCFNIRIWHPGVIQLHLQA